MSCHTRSHYSEVAIVHTATLQNSQIRIHGGLEEKLYGSSPDVDPSDDLKYFRLKKVTFGTKTAPFLTIKCQINVKMK